MNGTEKFEFNGKDLGFDFKDYWQFHYSNIHDLQDTIAEFIVAKALGIEHAQNVEYWTLWDITYRKKRIEVKETSYYHSFNAEGKVSKIRTFSIAKANGSYDEQVSGNKEFCRQNDIYVFCLNTGDTKATSYPLNLNNWEFYIVPTDFLNKHCENQKTISLNRIKSFGFKPLNYDQIKDEIDRIIDKL